MYHATKDASGEVFFYIPDKHGTSCYELPPGALLVSLPSSPLVAAAAVESDNDGRFESHRTRVAVRRGTSTATATPEQLREAVYEIACGSPSMDADLTSASQSPATPIRLAADVSRAMTFVQVAKTKEHQCVVRLFAPCSLGPDASSNSW